MKKFILSAVLLLLCLTFTFPQTKDSKKVSEVINAIYTTLSEKKLPIDAISFGIMGD